MTTFDLNTAVLGAKSGFSSRWERLLWCMICAAAFSLAANGYSFFSFAPLHDAVLFMNYWDPEWQVALGRFLIPGYMAVRGSIPMPWVSGMLQMFYLGLCVYFVGESMGLDSKLETVLLAGFLCANLFTTEINAAHQYFSDMFVLSALLASAGAAVLIRRSGWKWAILGAVLLFLSFGLYPAFLTLAVCLFGYAAVREIVQNGAWTRALTVRIVVWGLALLAAGLLYLLCARLALMLWHAHQATVAWSMFSPTKFDRSALQYRAISNYRMFLSTFFYGKRRTGYVCGLASSLLALLALILFIRSHRTRLKGRYWILVILSAALFPLVSRLVNVLGNGEYRTIYAQFLLYPILLGVIFGALKRRDPDREGEPRQKRQIVGAVVLLSAVILLINIRFSNGAYTVQHVLYERMVYHTEKVVEDLQMFTGGELGDRNVVMCGVFDLPDRDQYLQQYAESEVAGLKRDTGITYAQVVEETAYMLGLEAGHWSDAPEAVLESREVQDMPCYPEEGYIREIGSDLIVKLSEPTPDR